MLSLLYILVNPSVWWASVETVTVDASRCISTVYRPSTEDAIGKLQSTLNELCSSVTSLASVPGTEAELLVLFLRISSL